MGPYENPSEHFSVLPSVLEWPAYNNHGVWGERDHRRGVVVLPVHDSLIATVSNSHVPDPIKLGLQVIIGYADLNQTLRSFGEALLSTETLYTASKT